MHPQELVQLPHHPALNQDGLWERWVLVAAATLSSVGQVSYDESVRYLQAAAIDTVRPVPRLERGARLTELFSTVHVIASLHYEASREHERIRA